MHFSFAEHDHVEGSLSPERRMLMRDVFDLPDLAAMDDGIANGTYEPRPGEPQPLAAVHRAARGLFAAPPAPLHRHGARALPELRAVHQLPVLHRRVRAPGPRRHGQARQRIHRLRRTWQRGHAPRGPGRRGQATNWATQPPRLPQMPAYHLVRADRSGITMVNIGVGPANAKTITDHIAVLRPHAWMMLGHCAGLRNSQQLGDYVLAHAYVREDHVLDEELPLWVPIPALAEIQVALEQAVADVTQLGPRELKRIMRTGTVASTDNRNWELLPDNQPQRRFSQSRAVALDMESATIAANGFRFRVPYGTLLCVSDKPLHGEIKLPGMANHFYRERVDQHLRIGMRAR
ncbi:MAG: AMP nucleosidase [Giesbergeria sp.]